MVDASADLGMASRKDSGRVPEAVPDEVDVVDMQVEQGPAGVGCI